MKATLKENEEKIVSVSELNNGGAGKIFLDLQKNNSEYIILKTTVRRQCCFQWINMRS